MEHEMQIGEVADFFQISLKTLRMYDEMGLLVPYRVDEKTKYRYYSPEQIADLNIILTLKDIGIKLEEIKELFDNKLDPVQFKSLLDKKYDHWKREIEKAWYQIGIIDEMRRRFDVSTDSEASDGEENRAYRLARLVCLENSRNSGSGLLSEILWL